MADEQNVVKRIDWGEVFSFPHIFKSLSMSLHMGKLALALAAIVLLFVGGYVLQSIWSVADGQARPGEILAYAQTPPQQFAEQLEKQDEARLERAAGLLANAMNQKHQLAAFKSTWQQLSGSSYAIKAFNEKLTDYNKKNESGADGDRKSPSDILKQAKENGDDYDDLISDAEAAFDEELDKIYTLLDESEGRAETLLKEASLKEEQRETAEEKLDEAWDQAAQAITQRRLQFNQQVRQITGVGLFETFVDYQLDCLHNAIMSVRYLNFTGGLCRYQQMVAQRQAPPATLQIDSGLQDPAAMMAPNEQNGLLYYLLMAVEGYRWLIMRHWLFALILLVWAMALASLFGGAIYRMAALHFAREEKISIGQALRFSQKKFLSFFLAPLVPVGVIVVAGLLIALGGLLFSLIPYVGPILMGLLFGVALIIGMGIAFMLIGLVVGGPLMYPTIAVEGSDSFDAVSRSFSYIYERPFRTILYAVVAAIYGMITYLFVRLFAYLALCAAHWWASAGFWDLYPMYGGGEKLNASADSISVWWHEPSFWNLSTFNWSAMGGFDMIVAVLIGIWVMIVAGLVASYLVTYFASSTTCIYYILRRRVDATDLDDVYVEEVDESPEETPAEETTGPESPEDEQAEQSAEDTSADQGGTDQSSESSDEEESPDDSEEKSD